GRQEGRSVLGTDVVQGRRCGEERHRSDEPESDDQPGEPRCKRSHGMKEPHGVLHTRCLDDESKHADKYCSPERTATWPRRIEIESSAEVTLVGDEWGPRPDRSPSSAAPDGHACVPTVEAA